MNWRKRFRRLHLLFVCIGILECFVLVALLFSPHILGMFGSVETRANIIAALGSLILATALVFSNLVQKPALRFLGVMIRPSDADLADGYRVPLYVGDTAIVQVFPKHLKRFPRLIHEYSIEEYSDEDVLKHRQIYPDRRPLEYQKRLTQEHRFPRKGELKGGFHKLKITTIAARKNSQKQSGYGYQKTRGRYDGAARKGRWKICLRIHEERNTKRLERLIALRAINCLQAFLFVTSEE